MFRMPINTNERTTTQPKFCSALAKRFCTRSPKTPEEVKQDSSPESDGEKNKEKKKGIGQASECYKIKCVLKKLKMTTPFLTKVLQFPEVYGKGKNGCETCSMDKETYKSMFKSVKVIEIIVDSAISTAQKEMLDKNDKPQHDKQNENVSLKEEKKLSIKFEVYSQKGNDEHNFKCVLLNLQKTIGETLVQISFCKLNKNADDEKCKSFNVPIDLVERLKFEYTNLTGKIIQLFNRPPTKQKPLPEVCIACKKEELTECTKTLRDILKTGRNLKVTMRNEEMKKGQCCSRGYPHVHAVVQDRPVVLKFSLPFDITQPEQSKTDVKSQDFINKDESTPPYDEWPKNFVPEPSEREEPSESPQDQGSYRRSTDIAPSETETSYQREAPVQEESPTPKQSTEENQPLDDNLDGKELKVGRSPSPSTSVKSPSGGKESQERSPASSNESVTTLKSRPTSDLGKESLRDSKSLRKSSTFSEKEVSPNNSKLSGNGSSVNQKPKTSSTISKSSQTENISKNKDSNFSKHTSPVSSYNSNMDPNCIDTGIYCGCNFNEVYKRFNEKQQQKKDYNSRDGSPDGSTDSESEDELVNLGSKTGNSKKEVSFLENKKTVYTMEINPKHPLFAKHLDKLNQSTGSYGSLEFVEKEMEETSPTAVNSVKSLTKKYSTVENQKLSQELKRNHGAAKATFTVSEHEIKQTPQTKLRSLEDKQPTSLSKHQVSEVLKDLGATKLLSVSFPAECCKNNNIVNDFSCVSDLPFSASLHSLPLDQDDLNHITKAVEKNILNADLVLIPDHDNEWEIQYAENSDIDKEENIEWHQTLLGRDTVSNICIEIQTDKPVYRKKISKNITYRENSSILPTIEEEEILLRQKSSKTLSSKGKEEMKSLSTKDKSITKLRTTELRFLTVEYPNISVTRKASNTKFGCRPLNSKKNMSFCTQKDQNYNIKRESTRLDRKKIERSIDCSDYFCSKDNIHWIESSAVDYELSGKRPHGCGMRYGLDPIDEMIMLNVIYLSSPNTITNKIVTDINSKNRVSITDSPKSLGNTMSSCDFTTFVRQWEDKSNNFCSDIPSQIPGAQPLKFVSHQDTPKIRGNFDAMFYNYSKMNEGNVIYTKNINSNPNINNYSQVRSSHENYDCMKLKETKYNTGSQGVTCLPKKGNCATKIKINEFIRKIEHSELKLNSPSRLNTIMNSSMTEIEGNTGGNYLKKINNPPKMAENNFEEKYDEKYLKSKSYRVDAHCEKEKSYKLKVQRKYSPECLEYVSQNFEGSKYSIDMNFTLNNPTETGFNHSILDFHYNHKEFFDSINLHSLNHRSYLIHKKFRSKPKTHLNGLKPNSYQGLKRKPLILRNTTVGYKSNKCKISKPELKFARIEHVISHHGIPVLMTKPKNGIQTNEVSTNNSVVLDKRYLRVKSISNPATLKGDTTSLENDFFKENSVIETSSDQNQPKSNLLMNKNEPSTSIIYRSKLIEIPLRKIFHEKNEMHLTDKEEHIMQLFEISDQQSTDSSDFGKPLQDTRSESFPVMNEDGVFNDSGGALGLAARDHESFSVLTSADGPMNMLDLEKPFTGASRTVLVDSSSNGCLHFCCNGNPVSGFREISLLN